MKRKIMISICSILILCALTGCQLARESAGADAYEDRLIGMFVTTEYLDLFDMDAYLNDSLSGFQGGDITVDGDTRKYEGQLYATMVARTQTNEETGETSEVEEYVFPNIDGISYFYFTTLDTEGRDSTTIMSEDPSVVHEKMDIHASDDAYGMTMEGMIYVSPTDEQRELVYYFNPVFQSADGSVYVSSGSGVANQGVDVEGSTMSQTMDATYAVTENGKVKTDSVSIKLSISVIFTPEKIAVLQMDAESKLLMRTEYAPDAVPEALVFDSGTDYIIVETHKRDVAGDAITTRDIYSRDAETIQTFFARTDGICVMRSTQIKWSE